MVPAILVLSFSICFAAEKKEEKTKPAQSIPELQQQLEKILKDTHTPGVSVAIVHKDGPEWVAGLGVADVASGRANTADTLFRIGSTSKAFASLSILLLKNQGKVSLDDPVHKLVPDLFFENRWESTDPIRIVNLLEHTTGWDDMHLREYAKQAPDSMSLREGLDYDHTSRVSRWRPGTRMAYCNSGPPAAAYIVEKLTGQRFEDFVQQNLFLPIGMKTATYFEPAAGTATTLYHEDGKTPYPYWHILLRPAGSINASAHDMAAYVQFYLNRGAVGADHIVLSSDIDRMEVPESTWAAREGLKTGYGLSNYWSIEDGFVYHGHDGGVEGGLTNMAYMADYGVGYFFSINSGNGGAFEKIAKAIRAYITGKLQKPVLPSVASLPANAADYAGWYEPNSPRVQLAQFIDRLAGLSWAQFRDGHLTLTTLGGKKIFVPVAGSQFRQLPKDDAADPVPSLELLTPNAEGRFIQSGMMGTLKKIPAWYAAGEILLTAYFVLSVVAIVIYAPFWLLGGLSARRRRPAERAMRLFPLLAVLSLFAFVGIFILCADDLIARMGNQTFWSEALRVTTLAYAVSVLFSAYAWWRAPKEGVRRGVRIFSRVVTLALLISAAYFGYWGILNLRTWT
ncbi:MAG TPA: serine hydrolase domain-containing protein [Candidatus Sulfotelmatobacter sp.]|nr:serine hydrolase domain-containing protein [Candidatus Sulfotelmatobacter sp.]